MTFSISTELLEPLLDRGLIPTPLLRAGINHLCRKRLSKECFTDRERVCEAERDFIQQLDQQQAIASNTEDANEQHYEVPTRYFELVLGKHLKYSCCVFPGNILYCLL